MSFQRILVSIEDLPSDHSVFAAALKLAQTTNAVLKLLHCVASVILPEPSTTMRFETDFSPNLTRDNYETQEIILEQHIEEAQVSLKHYLEEAMKHNVPTESEYQVGELGYVLCKAAKDWGADLIVVGRRGRTGLAGALLGNAVNYVVHHAPCAVLVVQTVKSE